MRLTICVVAALTIAGAAGTSAREKRLPWGFVVPDPLFAEKSDPAIAKLIQDLGNEDYRTREKAGRELAALGERALPQMRSALRDTESPEVQRRLAVMIRKFDMERLVSPKRVTIAKREMTVKAAVDEIVKQTGYKIEYSGSSPDDKHTFEFDGVPFWEAIDRVAALGGGTTQMDYQDSTIRIYNQESVNPYVTYVGPFRFMATNINSSDSIQLSGISKRGGVHRYSHLNFGFQISSEPKNPMLGVTQAEIVSVVDEFGSSMALPRNPNDRSHYYNNNNSFRGFNTSAYLAMTRGDKTATKIKTLKGKIGVVMLSGTSPEIVIPDPLKVKNRTFVGRTIEIEFGSLTADPNNKEQYVLEVTARKLGNVDPDRPDYNWSNFAWQKIELIDGNGNLYRTYGPNNSNNNGHSVQMTIPYGNQDNRGNRSPQKLIAPVKLVVNEWLSITHEVNFEFKNIPLP